MTLTLPELGLFTSLYSGLLAVFMIIVWRINRAEHGPGFWTGAALTGVVVFAMIYLQPKIGERVIIVNNVASVLGPLLLLEGILRFRGIGNFHRRLPWAIGALVLVAVSATVNLQNAPARFMLHDPIIIAVLLLSAWFLVQNTAGIERALHGFTALFFLVFAATLGFRWQAAVRGMFEPAQHDNPITGMLFLVTMLWALAWAFGLTLSANFRARQRLSTLAGQDMLTGLPNRRHLHHHLARLLARAHNDRRGLAIVMMDFKGFKGINDQHGHQFGDQVLQAFAVRLTAQVRPQDLAVRYGGDEFVIVLADIESRAQLDEVSRRLRRGLEQEMRIGNRLVDIQISLGTSLYPADGSDVDALLDLADRRMYAHKSDQVRVSTVRSADGVDIDPVTSSR